MALTSRERVVRTLRFEGLTARRVMYGSARAIFGREQELRALA